MRGVKQHISIDLFFGWFESIPELADLVDESHWTVSKWKQRRSIPSEYWAAVIRAAKTKGKDLSADDLLAMHDRARRSA